MINIADFSCKQDCQFVGKDWPRYLPMPTCRVIHQALQENNPVTVASYRMVIANRIGQAKVINHGSCLQEDTEVRKTK